eukprot:scaffold5434_cov59-Phaeocystis_antarctica.AAC.6
MRLLPHPHDHGHSARQHGPSAPLGSARAQLLRRGSGRAWRLWAAPRGRGRATGRSATASAARASRLLSR